MINTSQRNLITTYDLMLNIVLERFGAEIIENLCLDHGLRYTTTQKREDKVLTHSKKAYF
jgi:hypothetical protein